MSLVFDVDQEPFSELAGTQQPVTGSVTALLDLVPNFGCDRSDFSAFTSGDIALIMRGGTPSPCAFSTKAANA